MKHLVSKIADVIVLLFALLTLGAGAPLIWTLGAGETAENVGLLFVFSGVAISISGMKQIMKWDYWKRDPEVTDKST